MKYKKIEYKDSYFKDRELNDPLRLKSFDLELKFLKKYILSGNVLDIGCSTGEFLKFAEWDGEKFGMEVSQHAIKLAEQSGISFTKDIFNTQDFFDLIIFRGTIQHIDTPFQYLIKSYDALKDGGYLVFLATPNANSLYYKIWNTLPFLAPKLNFYIPSDKDLINAMQNIGFNFIEVEYPYLRSPYSNPFKDHVKFILKLFGFKTKFPFWRNSMNIIFRK